MQLPFTHGQFLDVFAAYNHALWPFALLVWISSVLVIGISYRSKVPRHRWLSGLLAVHWAWSALAYHAAFFAAINPLAWLFAVLFLIQTGLFVWKGLVRSELRFSTGWSIWHLAGWSLLAYALAYPAFNWALGYRYPRIPTFGIPCPSMILTAGLLLMTTGKNRLLIIAPVLWSVIGGSAAFLLEIRADLPMIPAGVALVLYALFSRVEPFPLQSES
jgi:Family of unknown function (DUF6064)